MAPQFEVAVTHFTAGLLILNLYRTYKILFFFNFTYIMTNILLSEMYIFALFNNAPITLINLPLVTFM